MQNSFNYIKQNDKAVENSVRERKSCSIYTVEFPSAFIDNSLGIKKVLGEYHKPDGDKLPLIIIAHGMGDSSMVPCRLIAGYLVKKGFAVFIPYLLFHRDRVTPDIKSKYPSLSPQEWLESYQLSVIDIRQVVDWAEKREEIDSSRIGLIGISFGSFISAITFGVDDRIKAGILIESGGNSDKLTKHSFLLSKVYKTDHENFEERQQEYHKYLKSVLEKGFKNVEPLHKSYLTDPLTYSHMVNGRPVMMINALFDEMIPRVATKDLWRAYGKPPINWFPATHASLWVWYPLINRRIRKFLESSLNGSER
jgi:cephalosporin-C deacetylase-like acetyl esterase